MHALDNVPRCATIKNPTRKCRIELTGYGSYLNLGGRLFSPWNLEALAGIEAVRIEVWPGVLGLGQTLPKREESINVVIEHL